MVREPQHQDQLQSMVFSFFKEYKIARLLKQSNITKQAGVAVLDVFRVIFSLVFTQRSLNRWLKQSGGDGFGKDTMYRFLNSPRHNWRRFLLLLSAAVVQRMSRLTSDDRADVLIVDDSLFSRSRSKKVELLARVYDRVSQIRAWLSNAYIRLVGRELVRTTCLLVAQFRKRVESPMRC